MYISGFWKTVIYLVVFCLLVVGAYIGYTYYKSYKDPRLAAIHAITPEAVFFAEINDAETTLYKITQQSKIWQGLATHGNIQKLNKNILFIDSLFSKHSLIKEILAVQKFIVSFNLTSDGSIHPVFLVELPQGIERSRIEAFIREKNGDKCIIMQKEFEGVLYDLVNMPALNSIFYCTVHYGVFIGSFQEELVTAAIHQVDHGSSLTTKENFIKIAATAGKNVDANIYINFSQLDFALKGVLASNLTPQLNELKKLATYTETDLIINDDELLLNGYSVTSDTLGYLLDAFRQAPQRITIPDILPYNIPWMALFGVADFGRFIREFDANRNILLYAEQLKNKFEIDLHNEIFSWIGNEFAIAESEGDQILVIRSKDVIMAGLRLEIIEQKVNRNKGLKPVRIQHEGYQIRKLNIPEIQEKLFGSLFSGIIENYYVTIKDYVIFANRPEALINVVNNFYVRKTLAENNNFQAFSNNISDKSNVFLYGNFRRLPEPFVRLLSDPGNKAIMEYSETIQNLEAVALQFSYINRMFYTNVYLKYNPGYQETTPTTWLFSLDSDIQGQPYFVKNHRNGKLNIIVFDSLNNMYIADHIGTIKWKIPLIEAPKSEVITMDFYNNGKNQYFFNTENYVYLIDIEGNYVADFPKKLMTKTTGPAAVFDYEDKNDYRILLPMLDNKVYNFDKEMNEVDGWNKIQANAAIHKSVQHLVAGSKDYLFVTDANGNIQITDRQGNQRIKIKNKFKQARQSRFYINNTNSKGLFLTTDDKGNVIYIDGDGKTDRTAFGNFSEDHFFLYDDFDGNGAEDFIFADGKTLVVFDRLKKEIFRHEFEEDLVIPPVIFTGRGGIKKIGVTLPNLKQVQIFNKNGLISSTEVIQGNTSFVVGSINNNNTLNLIIGSGDKVINYILEE